MDKKATVVGIGRLGLCFSLTLERAGYSVIGVDISQDYVDTINNKTLSSPEEGVAEHLAIAKNFRATTSLEEGVRHSDVMFVVVATPSLPCGRYDHSQIDKVLEELEQLPPPQECKNLII